MTTPRKATVAIRNATGAPCRFQVMHQYTGDSTEDSGFILLQSGEQRQMLTVDYHTGFLTTGVDNWMVNGIERREIIGAVKLSPELAQITLDGKIYVDIRWHSGTGALSDWKKHTLRAEDENTET